MSESLTVDGELLSGPIKCEDLSLLRNFVRRGANRPLPRVTGRRTSSRLPIDELNETLTFKIDGMSEPDGTPYADPKEGVELNLEHYRALFEASVLHDVVLAFAGTTFSGEVQIPDYAQQRTGPLSAIAIARFVVPAGSLTEDGP